jgi:GDP-D-mannose dehydratase
MATALAAEGNNGCALGGFVCVTGGSGFIGSWLVRLLLDRGYTVHATVKNLRKTLLYPDHLHALT